MSMQDTRESRERPASVEGEEPLQSRGSPQSTNLPPDERNPVIPHDGQESAAEDTDVIADSSQEPGEDTTAAEETAPPWQAVVEDTTVGAEVSPQHRPPASIGESHMPRITLPSVRPELDSDILESAGETADAIRDAAQTGEDSLADSAEDLSMKGETPNDTSGSGQMHQNRH